VKVQYVPISSQEEGEGDEAERYRRVDDILAEGAWPSVEIKGPVSSAETKGPGPSKEAKGLVSSIKTKGPGSLGEAKGARPTGKTKIVNIPPPKST